MINAKIATHEMRCLFLYFACAKRKAIKSFMSLTRPAIVLDSQLVRKLYLVPPMFVLTKKQMELKIVIDWIYMIFYY